MNNFPTTADLADLGSRIAEDGFAKHEKSVAELVEFARDIEPTLVSADILADQNAPEVVRSRALVRLGNRWDQLQQQHLERQEQFDRSLAELLDVWNAHQELRRSADVASLADSRAKLDALRWAVAEKRNELHLHRHGLAKAS